MSKNKKKMTPKAKKAAPQKKLKKPVKVKAKPKVVEAVMAKASKVSAKKAAPVVHEKAKAPKALKGSTKVAPPVPEVPQEEVVLTNADGQRYCRVIDCDEIAVIDGHCRLHYIMFWKRTKNKHKVLEGGKLDKYIEELTQRYPDKYLEMLRKDLLSEKEFSTIIVEMDADDANDEAEEEDDGRFIDEVRGVPSTSDDDDAF